MSNNVEVISDSPAFDYVVINESNLMDKLAEAANPKGKHPSRNVVTHTKDEGRLLTW